MHAAACRPLVLRQGAWLSSCRHVAGRRFPLRSFHTSRTTLQNSPSEGPNESPSQWQQSLSDTKLPGNSKPEESAQHDGTIANNPEPPEPPDSEDHPTELSSHFFTTSGQDAPSAKSSKGPYGSAKRRMRRNNAQKQDNIASMAPPQNIASNIVYWQPLAENEAAIKEVNGGNASSKPDEDIYPNATVGGGSYMINRDVLFEVQASVNAGLKPTWSGEAESLAASKPHLVLQSPRDGGRVFLDDVVANVARRCQADLIQLEAQDIAEYIADNDPMSATTYTTGTLRTLGYDTHVAPFHEKGSREQFDEPTEDDAVQEDDFGETQPSARLGRPSQRSSSFVAQPMVVSVGGDMGDVLKSLGLGGKPMSRNSKSDESITGAIDPPTQSGNSLVMRLVDSLVSEVNSVRKGLDVPLTSPNTEAESSGGTTTTDSRGIILHIKDYLEIYSTAAGNSLIRHLNDLVLRKRKEGSKILLIGSTSSEDLLPTNTQEGWRDIQNESTSGPYRTIIVPCTSPDVNDLFKNDETNRTKEINFRHLQDMIKRLTSDPESTDSICKPGNMQLQNSSTYASGLSESVWSFEHIQRLAHTALGLSHSGEDLTVEHVEWALNMMQSSDQAKSDWLGGDKKKARKLGSASLGTTSQGREARDERMQRLRKTSNNHEKRLLGGVIDAEKIKTTFGDVRANPSTIDALRNLTSLSLTRPEAFTYGVLAAEKIPGLLLYGPPGTGKTLLAKAVAKESGATILEVSGADIFDMYVGEGEKNVRAIFSLARKVSPCVVFIDEADALFSQRSNNSVRNTHREIVNQFLREWDGMSENSTFIMVATNRPFDLDDAVLRRLPRRILIDLPTEQDREAIIKIHLEGEQLAEDVNIQKLAQKTPFYSGSDLKNVCVAAALAAVREETEAAVKQTSVDKSTEATQDETSMTLEGNRNVSPKEDDRQDKVDSTPQYPERRTLRNEHFDKALEEISASISEDMSTLNAIRKFDEKYGDRKGRKKRPGGYGFGLLTEKERDKIEDGRIRTG